MRRTNTPRIGESAEQSIQRGMVRADAVNHPPHYNSHPSGIECITVTEHMNFNLGNAVKYIWRVGLKSEDPIVDLEKARWYIDREIVRLKKSQPGAGGHLAPLVADDPHASASEPASSPRSPPDDAGSFNSRGHT